MVLSPKESGSFISKHAVHVSIIEDGVEALAKELLDALKTKKLGVDQFSQNELHPSSDDESAAVAWIFVVDTLNFSFWAEDDTPKKWEVTWKGTTYTGYFALCAAINKALHGGVPITDPNFYKEITIEKARELFRGDNSTDIPMLNERVNCLHEVGKVITEKYEGSFVNCIKQCKNSALNLLQLTVDNFPCYKDEANFEGHTVSFYKRAQILIGDIWACFKGKGLGYFEDIDSIGMFADYRVPQVLVHFGAMKYSEELMEKLKSGHLIMNGSREEIEIRGISIEVVERVCDKVKLMLRSNNVQGFTINSILVDHYLWDYRRRNAEALNHIPFHKVRCIFY